MVDTGTGVLRELPAGWCLRAAAAPSPWSTEQLMVCEGAAVAPHRCFRGNLPQHSRTHLLCRTLFGRRGARRGEEMTDDAQRLQKRRSRALFQRCPRSPRSAEAAARCQGCACTAGPRALLGLLPGLGGSAAVPRRGQRIPGATA